MFIAMVLPYSTGQIVRNRKLRKLHCNTSENKLLVWEIAITQLIQVPFCFNKVNTLYLLGLKTTHYILLFSFCRFRGIFD